MNQSIILWLWFPEQIVHLIEAAMGTSVKMAQEEAREEVVVDLKETNAKEALATNVKGMTGKLN